MWSICHSIHLLHWLSVYRCFFLFFASAVELLRHLTIIHFLLHPPSWHSLSCLTKFSVPPSPAPWFLSFLPFPSCLLFHFHPPLLFHGPVSVILWVCVCGGSLPCLGAGARSRERGLDRRIAPWQNRNRIGWGELTQQASLHSPHYLLLLCLSVSLFHSLSLFLHLLGHSFQTVTHTQGASEKTVVLVRNKNRFLVCSLFLLISHFLFHIFSLSAERCAWKECYPGLINSNVMKRRGLSFPIWLYLILSLKSFRSLICKTIVGCKNSGLYSTQHIIYCAVQTCSEGVNQGCLYQVLLICLAVTGNTHMSVFILVPTQAPLEGQVIAFWLYLFPSAFHFRYLLREILPGNTLPLCCCQNLTDWS